ncbi:hypothetical protein [Sandarakinorhabdus sp. DWP1-3-1]|uniref:hypothetical protein n=1 Tax=Sandarakinorhabdus sp. DWP1-3-1 TaxID=2804627 RepID=UPI003CF4166A
MLARTKLLLLGLMGLSACAPSPLYVGNSRAPSLAEVPRDSRGEPLWNDIRAPVPVPPIQPYPTGQGIAIQPPPGAVPLTPPPPR